MCVWIFEYLNIQFSVFIIIIVISYLSSKSLYVRKYQSKTDEKYKLYETFIFYTKIYVCV